MSVAGEATNFDSTSLPLSVKVHSECSRVSSKLPDFYQV